MNKKTNAGGEGSGKGDTFHVPDLQVQELGVNVQKGTKFKVDGQEVVAEARTAYLGVMGWQVRVLNAKAEETIYVVIKPNGNSTLQTPDKNEAIRAAKAYKSGAAVIEIKGNRERVIFENGAEVSKKVFTAMVVMPVSKMVRPYDFEANDHKDAERIAQEKWGKHGLVVEGVVQNSAESPDMKKNGVIIWASKKKPEDKI